MPLATPVNTFIETLPRRKRDRFIRSCERVDMSFGTVLCEPEVAFRHVYFPLTGFISLLEVVRGHPPLEMGLIGNEGMLGATLVLKIRESPLQGMVQGPGSALRMTVPQFHRELQDIPALQRSMNGYVYVLMAQLAQTAACTHFHEIAARLARWLLSVHDRAQADHFRLTHRFLAEMLGVQRSAVTIAAGELQNRNIIRYTRGEIRILDRQRLEAASCECYRASTADYARIFNPGNAD